MSEFAPHHLGVGVATKVTYFAPACHLGAFLGRAELVGAGLVRKRGSEPPPSLGGSVRLKPPLACLHGGEVTDGAAPVGRIIRLELKYWPPPMA
jgi:hypothetical protein